MPLNSNKKFLDITLSQKQFLENLNVLLVDDEKINQIIGTHLLKQWDINVDTAEDGEKAIVKIKNNQYDVVLMDLNMPIMSGVEATVQLRKNRKFKKLPIIALSATSSDEELADCMKMGMNNYLVKPFTQEDLYDVIVKCLSKAN